MPPTAEHHPRKLTDEDITIMRDEMKQAVREGMTEALTADAARQFWSIGLTVLQEQASAHTGRFVLDGLGDILKKAFWFAVFIVAIYSFGGWTMVKTAVAAIFGRS